MALRSSQDTLLHLSCLVDEESLTEEPGDVDYCLDRFGGRELREKWYRYHLIRDALRGCLPEKVSGSRPLSLVDVEALSLQSAPGGRAQYSRREVAGFAVVVLLAVCTVLLHWTADVDDVRTAPLPASAQQVPVSLDGLIDRESVSSVVSSQSPAANGDAVPAEVLYRGPVLGYPLSLEDYYFFHSQHVVSGSAAPALSPHKRLDLHEAE